MGSDVIDMGTHVIDMGTRVNDVGTLVIDGTHGNDTGASCHGRRREPQFKHPMLIT